MDAITRREFFLSLGCLAIAVGARLPIGTSKDDFYYRFRYELFGTRYWTSGLVSWHTFSAVAKTHPGFNLVSMAKVPLYIAEKRYARVPRKLPYLIVGTEE